MCGVNIPLGDISMPTPLSMPENPIGMEVRKVPNTVKNENHDSNGNVKKGVMGEDVLSIRLKDVRTSVDFFF